MAKINKIFWYSLRFLLLLFLISVPQFVLSAFIAGKLSFLVAFLLFIILYLGALFCLFKTLKSLTTQIFRPLTPLQIKTVFLTLGATYIVNIFYALFSTNTQTQNNQVITELFSLNLQVKIMMAFMTVIFAPLCEELLFRGILINSFSAKYNGLGILLSGVLFGLVHLNNSAMGFLLYMTIGWLLAYSYCRHNNLTVSWCVHFLINTIATIGLFLS